MTKPEDMDIIPTNVPLDELLKNEPEASGNGAVDDPWACEDTGDVRAAILGATRDDGAASRVTTHDIATTLMELMDGSGGGGRGGSHVKQIKRHNLGTILAVVISVVGGGVGSYYALVDRSKHNEEAAEQNAKRIDETEKDVKFIKVKVNDIDNSMDKMSIEQTVIKDGINELKKESINELKDELQDAKRELRRRNRRPR